MKRSAMIAVSAAALGASTLPVHAQSADTVRFGVVGVEEAALPYYAQEKGLFRAAGVNVALTIMPNGGSVTQGILAGALDIGVANVATIAVARTRGVQQHIDGQDVVKVIVVPDKLVNVVVR